MSLKKWFSRRSPSTSAEVEGDGAALSEQELARAVADVSNADRPARVGIWLLLLGLGGFLAWAFFAPLDEGVPAPGTVVVDTKPKTIQHLSGGIVRKILVNEAQEVKAGQLLMVLDDTQARANYQAARQQYFALRAQESRLLAERQGLKRIQFHPDLLAERDDPLALNYMNLQEELFEARQGALRGDLAIIEQNLTGARETLDGLNAQLRAKEGQLTLILEQLEHTRQLAADGYLPRNRWYDEERLAAEVRANIAELKANIARAQSAISELELRKMQRKKEFLRDVEALLADTSRDALVASERLRVAREDLERTEIRSPVDGVVVGLAAHTVGGVIPPAARIMEIVPKGVPLTLEARVEPHLIDQVHAGLPADIRIHAFIDNPNLVVEGRVISVSADLVKSEQPNSPPYYLARVAVTPLGMKQLGNRQLHPGMPAEVIIKTGERTFIHYLFTPLIRRLTAAFHEA